jgi:elongation factor P--(R)-beta-lysine ligase
MHTWQRYKSDDKYRRNIRIRAKVMEAIRDFFASEGFMEIEAPLLVRSPDLSPNLSSMKATLTDEKGKSVDAHLITSPEFSMKKMLAAGCDKIFSLGKTFRNGEHFGGSHNPEFTMLEWYRRGADYRKMMDDTERLVKYCADAAIRHSRESGDPIRPGDSYGLDSRFRGNDEETGWAEMRWRRVSVKDVFAEIGLNLDLLLTRDSMAQAAADRGHRVSGDDTFDDCFFRIFLTEIEPKLGVLSPTILYDYPIQMAALARPKPEDPRYAERFEAYAGGLELCNCFSELTDAEEQRRRFTAENAERKRMGKDVPPMDEDLLAALPEIGSAAGNALGVDRLVMLLCGAKAIEDVMLFPASELFDNK